MYGAPAHTESAESYFYQQSGGLCSSWGKKLYLKGVGAFGDGYEGVPTGGVPVLEREDMTRIWKEGPVQLRILRRRAHEEIDLLRGNATPLSQEGEECISIFREDRGSLRRYLKDQHHNSFGEAKGR